MNPRLRESLLAPSNWDVLLAPDVAPLFVVEAAIVAAERFLLIDLASTSHSDRALEPSPTRALLRSMHPLRRRIARHRLAETTP